MGDSYLVLARKYRPQVFDDIVGQGHVTRTLANAISSGRVAHAYLFCGPRGVGKTTAARILAKALNCEKGPAATPCNTCSNCEEITGGRSLDVLEIDGASNRGIEEIRELRENTRYAPNAGRSKIYIVDEVHMLTREAFNALLKTLEEPPAHVVFVLATTDPFKVPGTILSRCQRFDFARISSRDIAAHLQVIVGEENLDATPDALAVVARRAQGGLRDALSLLDQIISAAEGTIDREMVERILGLVGADYFFQLGDRLADGDAPGALRLLADLYARGGHLEEMARGLTAHLRDLYLLRLDRQLADLVEVPESELERSVTQAARFHSGVLADLLDRAAAVEVEVRRSEHPLLAMELALAEMAEAAHRLPLAEICDRLLDLERRIEGGEVPPPRRAVAPASASGSGSAAPRPAGKRAPAASPPPSDAPAGRAAKTPAKTSAKTKEPEPPAQAVDPGSAAGVWASCLERLRETSTPLWATLSPVTAVGFHEDGSLLLRPEPDNALQADALRERKARDLLQDILEALGRKPGRVRLESDSPSGAKGTPAGPKGPEEDARSMGQIFKDEPVIQRVLDMFDGEVLP